MEGADAERGGAGERGALGLGALGGGDAVVGGGAHGVVGVTGQRRVRGVPGAFAHVRHEVEQGRGDHGGVHVGAGEVEGAPAGGLVELAAGRGSPLGPGAGVPAVAEQDPVGGPRRGVRPHPVQGLGERGGAGEVEAGQGEARGGGVHVGVHEGGG
ncbi:hypothetical protein GCM10020000_68260 [Streptomyces olivoverticillatus]